MLDCPISERPALNVKYLPKAHRTFPLGACIRAEGDWGIIYFTNVRDSYRNDQRKHFIRGLRFYYQRYGASSPEFQAYLQLVYHMFGDYIDAIGSLGSTGRKATRPRHLYILRNSKGFIKIGITSNLIARLYDFTHEFEGTFEVIRFVENAAILEQDLLTTLEDYSVPIQKRDGIKVSTECVADLPEVIEIIQNKIEEYVRSCEREQICIGS